MTLRRLYNALCISLAVGLSALARSDVHTFELKVNRDVSTGICKHARIRNSQHHRLLEIPHAPQVVTTRRHGQIQDGATAVEFVNMFAHDEDVLWRELEMLCPTALQGSGEAMPFSDSQSVFSSLSSVQAEVLPLDIRLISGTGPSDNRVDLTFFSDGCMHIPSPTVHVHSALIYARPRPSSRERTIL